MGAPLTTARQPDRATRQALQVLCKAHLQREAEYLASMLPLLQTLLAACRPRAEPASRASECHAEAVRQSDALARARRQFRAAAARLLDVPTDTITLTGLLERLPGDARHELADALDNVRRQADELAAASRRAAIFTRIHLDAYRRLLRDLTNSASGSGRYGPAGKAESREYRPLLQLHG